MLASKLCPSPTWQARFGLPWGFECSLVLQLFLLKADSLEAATYYVGVFNEDYYVHQPYSYTLQVCRYLLLTADCLGHSW